MATRIRQRLTQYGSDPEKLYQYLKAYVMLGQPEHLDKQHLLFLAQLEWGKGAGVSPQQAAIALQVRSNGKGPSGETGGLGRYPVRFERPSHSIGNTQSPIAKGV